MSSYKNQLTDEIIMKAFERYSSTRKKTYVELQTLYKTLCQMINDNIRLKKNKTFDRNIFQEIIEESILIKQNNFVMVEIQSLKVNLMRTEIFINQTLKTLNSQIAKIQKQHSNIHHLQISSNEKKSQLRLNELKQEKEESENNLFCLRLTFIKQEDLKLLMQKLSANGPGPNLNIEENSLKRIPIDEKSQQIKQSSSNESKCSYFKSIFVLTFVLIIFQSLSMIFYSNFTVNVLLFGMIMSIYVNRKYSRTILHMCLLTSVLSIVMDLGFIYFHFRNIFRHNMSSMIEKRAVMLINSLCGEYFVTLLTGTIFLTFCGKILLSVFLGMQLLDNNLNEKKLSLFGHEIQLKSTTILQSQTI